MKNAKLAPGNTVILAAGALIFVASFLGFYKFSIPAIEFGGITTSAHTTTTSAWSRGLFIVYTLPALLGLVMAGQVALDAFSSVTIARRPLGLTWDQVHLVLGLQATLMMLAMLVQSHRYLTLGIGFWLMLGSAIALLVGALLRVRESRSKPHAV